MKVVHIIKRIEAIDEDIKDLRKLEKSISSNKSFSTPIYLSIEKQINILLDTRNKYLGLTIANPPAELVKEIEGTDEAPKAESRPVAKPKPKAKKNQKPSRKSSEIDDIHVVTQDLIDQKFQRLKEEKEKEDRKSATLLKDEDDFDDDDTDDDEIINDNSVKLLDIALENGTLNSNSQDKDKRKVRFFKDNFPGGDY